MRRTIWTGAVLLLVVAVAALAAAQGRDDGRGDGTDACDRACQHHRLVRQCHADPASNDHCRAVLAHERDHRAAHMRTHCANHPDDARCHHDRVTDRPAHRDPPRDGDGEDARGRYCHAHPDDARCA